MVVMRMIIFDHEDDVKALLQLLLCLVQVFITKLFLSGTNPSPAKRGVSQCSVRVVRIVREAVKNVLAEFVR